MLFLLLIKRPCKMNNWTFFLPFFLFLQLWYWKYPTSEGMTHKLSYEGHILWRADIFHISLKAWSVLLGISYFSPWQILKLCSELDIRLFTVVHIDFEARFKYLHIFDWCSFCRYYGHIKHVIKGFA